MINFTNNVLATGTCKFEDIQLFIEGVALQTDYQIEDLGVSFSTFIQDDIYMANMTVFRNID